MPWRIRSQRDSDVGQATTAAPYACISVFIVSGTAAREQMAKAPEPARGGAERLGRHAGERREIVFHGEVHGDALSATVRAAREQAWLLEARVAAEALESEDARLRGHGGR